MILDNLINKEKYYPLNEYFKPAFDFIEEAVSAGMDEGEYEIMGRELYAIISLCEGKGRDNARLEAHEKYIDIQYAASGADVIGWEHTSECGIPEVQYDKEKDIKFFGKNPSNWVEIKDSIFCILFPHDAHAPQAGESPCKKIVIKIKNR